jgi:hypothetical protein
MVKVIAYTNTHMKTDKTIIQLTELVKRNNKITARAENVGEQLHKLVGAKISKVNAKASITVRAVIKPSVERLNVMYAKYNPGSKTGFIGELLIDSRITEFWQYANSKRRRDAHTAIKGTKLVSLGFKIIDRKGWFYDPANRKPIDMWPSKKHPDFAKARDLVNDIMAIYHQGFDTPEITALEKLQDSII